MKQWIITAEDPTKIGFFLFCGFHRYKPSWECSWCKTGKTKLYKDKRTVDKNIKRLKAIYPTVKFFITEIGECSTGAELNIYWSDGCTIEEREFPNRFNAEQYCKDNGIPESEYRISAKRICV